MIFPTVAALLMLPVVKLMLPELPVEPVPLGVEMEMLPLAVLEEPGVPYAIVMPPVVPPPPLEQAPPVSVMEPPT